MNVKYYLYEMASQAFMQHGFCYKLKTTNFDRSTTSVSQQIAWNIHLNFPYINDNVNTHYLEIN